MSKKVEKALTPEEATILSNISSLCQELVSMGGGEAPAPEEVAMAEGETPPMAEEEEAEGKEVKMIVKGQETTPSEGATASDNTEERMSEVQTEQTEENVNDVAKQFTSLLMQMAGGNVQKSAPKEVNPIVTALSQMADVQKSTQDQLNDLSTALAHVLKGMGVTEQMEIAKAEQKRTENLSNTSGNAEVLKAIQDAVMAMGGTVQKSTEREAPASTVHKNFGDRNILKGLLGK